MNHLNYYIDGSNLKSLYFILFSSKLQQNHSFTNYRKVIHSYRVKFVDHIER